MDVTHDQALVELKDVVIMAKYLHAHASITHDLRFYS
jgi:hypothetical protein